jgi:hypothetical protein
MSDPADSALAMEYVLAQQSIEAAIEGRLSECTSADTCPWLVARKPFTVIVARWQEDARWLSQLDTTRMVVVMYARSDSPLAARTAATSSGHYLPHALGGDAAVYLHYILAHYDAGNFSEYTAFTHEHVAPTHPHATRTHTASHADIDAKLKTLEYGVYRPFVDLHWEQFRCMRWHRNESAAGVEEWSHPRARWYREVLTPSADRFDAERLPPFEADGEDGKWPTSKAALIASQLMRDRLSLRPSAVSHQFISTRASSSPLDEAATSVTHSLRCRVLDSSLSTRVCNHCCSKFVVHRSRILAQPRRLRTRRRTRAYSPPIQPRATC